MNDMLKKAGDQLLNAADNNGHGKETRGAGVGGAIGGVIGSFGGPVGSAIGGSIGSFCGYLISKSLKTTDEEGN